MKLRIIILLSVLAVSVISIFFGCSSPFRSIEDNPSILIPIFDDSKNMHSLLALTAERRMVLIKNKAGAELNYVYCSEAPPDSTMSLSEAISASLKANYNTSVSVQGEFAKSMASYANQLFYRSQGVQLYRDGSYALCLAFMNGAINKVDYEKYLSDLLAKSSALITTEIPYLAEIKKASNPSAFSSMSSAGKKPPLQMQNSTSKAEINGKTK